MGPYKERVRELFEESKRMPRKQRYTGKKIYEIVKSEGFRGSQATIMFYLTGLRKEDRKPKVYLPLEYDPGADAQADWGDAQVKMRDEEVTVQLFVMRLCYSRKLFLRAFPSQKQESFFEGHVRAFRHFGGVPHRISYDNLKTAVYKVLEGKNRQEQEAFIVFRSHYLYESRYCNVGQGHEKGGVEHGVGFGRRNFMVPLPDVGDFEELNEYLLRQCELDDERRVKGQKATIGEMWREEQPRLLPLPDWDYECCVVRSARLTPYGQVIFETNRYSVPAEEAGRDLVIKAYPFRVDILKGEKIIASHPRCYDRDTDIMVPMHYHSLLMQRPGAFEHAKPLRLWKENWPPIYDELLARMRPDPSDSKATRDFLYVLGLNREYPARMVEEAIRQALEHGSPTAEGIELYLRLLLNPHMPAFTPIPYPDDMGSQPVKLETYDTLLRGGR